MRAEHRPDTGRGSPEAAPDAAVELRHASRRFGRVTAVEDISFRVAPGTICGLLAPSGGGKTTVLRLIIGIYPPSAGTVRVLGGEPTRFSAIERRRLGYMPQHFVLYPELSVRRNLQFVARLYGERGPSGARLEEMLALVELAEARDRPAGRLSGGMQRRLQLAAMLLHQPELMVIDEPTAGIDPILRAQFWSHFRALRDAGRTLIVSTQYVTEAEYCDQVVMMRRGGVVATGTPEDLRRQALGVGGAGDGRPPDFEEVFRRLVEAAPGVVASPGGGT